MSSIPPVTIAFCFNNENEAKNLSLKLMSINPEMSFITAPSFDVFLKSIAAVPQVDYFVIDENYKECSSIELIAKLKGSQRYKKSLISVFCTNARNLDSKFSEYNLDFVFDVKTDIHSVYEGLEKTLAKNLAPVIPKNFNILALDDEPQILEMISMNIHELGHTNLDLCKSVSEAKSRIQEKEYDLLLLDWNLKDGTCIDIMDFIKNNPVQARTKNALTVVVTGRDGVDDIMTLMRYGVTDTIIKPFDFKEFEDKLSYGIEKHLKKSK